MARTYVPPAVIPKRRGEPGAPGPSQLSLADEVATFELNALPDEVARYLDAVETFRALDAAPRYLAESCEVH